MAAICERWIITLLFFIASGINDAKQKKSLLLYFRGKESQKIHRSLNHESDEYQ